VSTRSGLRGRGLRKLSDIRRKAGLPKYSDMSSGHESSSEATESNDEAIAEGMMHLAIACDHVEHQSTPDAAAAGNLNSCSSNVHLGFMREQYLVRP
jgi:hypothetical protein